MCDICGMNPCHPRCPNAPEIATGMVCFYCDEPIYFGEEFLKSEVGNVVHAGCFSSMDREDVFRYFGEQEEVRTAEYDNEDY